jgi:hypothetical protein
LTALVEPDVGTQLALPAPLPVAPAPRVQAPPLVADASAAWIARLKHGPPALA